MEIIDAFTSGLLGKDGIIVFFAAWINLAAVLTAVAVSLMILFKQFK